MDEKNIDYAKITPCGECCTDCVHLQKGACRGCRETNGACIKMWENGCEIYRCSLRHQVLFCGICAEFPCLWLTEKISSWNPDGIAHLYQLAAQYRKQQL